MGLFGLCSARNFYIAGMVEALQNYLNRFIPFSGDDFKKIAQIAELRNYDKKVRVVDEGEVDQYFNFIGKGLVRKYFRKGKEEIITQLAKENEVINSSVSFLTGLPSEYIVETIEPTMFVSFRRSAIEDLYRQDRKWQKFGRLIMTDLFLQKESWEIDKVKMSTQQRFVQFLTTNPELMQRVPQIYLASYLHIKPETFSRLKHLLRKSYSIK